MCFDQAAAGHHGATEQYQGLRAADSSGNRPQTLIRFNQPFCKGRATAFISRGRGAGTHFHRSSYPGRRALARARSCSVLLGVLFISLAWAAPDATPRYGLTIPAGLPLDAALHEFAQQTGVQIVFFSQLTAGHDAPELSGEYTSSAALARLLDGSGLTFRQLNARTIEVRQQPKRRSATAPPAPVDEPMQEVTVVATVEQLVATRVPTPLREIPQSMSVISSEQIRQQNSVELGDVMRNAPGIATRRENSLEENAHARGFQITSYHVDGSGALKPSLNLFDNTFDLYRGSPDLSEFDRVEVLRGSDTLFTGNSNPGGTVSLVRKRPLRTPALNASVSIGSWNNYRIELDGTGPLVNDGSLRARADAVYATRDYFFDRAHLDRKKIFGALEYDITSTATLTMGGSYQRDDTLPLVNGFPLYIDGTDPHLPRDTALTTDWAFYNTRASHAYLQYRQHFDEDWRLSFNTSAGRTMVEYCYPDFGTFVDKQTGGLLSPTVTESLRPGRYTLAAVDATLSGKLNLFGLRHVIAIGADFTRIMGRSFDGTYTGGPAVPNVLAFDPALYRDPRGTRTPFFTANVRHLLDQYGAFVSWQVDVNDAWSVTGGARVSSDKARLAGGVTIDDIEMTGLSSEFSSSGVITPFAALLYRINSHYSWYASYADIHLTASLDPPPPLRADGTVVNPAHGVTLETGIKGAWRDGALNASLAAYRIDQRHIPVEDPTVTSSLPNCCYVAGTARSRGVELSVDGELAPGWLIGSGYTYNSSETPGESQSLTATPRHLLKIWTSKKLPDVLAAWTVGGALRAQTGARGTLYYDCDRNPTCPLAEGLSQRPYAVLDLRAAFEVNPAWEVALNVNNIFDKRYFLSQNSPNAQAWYGEPRNFMVRIDARY